MYGEVKTTRLRLAERLRKLPLGFFGKRDLADLTETLKGDVNRMEHVWSHVLGYLYGAYLSTAVIAVCLLWYDWRLALACLWGVPVAFGLLFGKMCIRDRIVLGRLGMLRYRQCRCVHDRLDAAQIGRASCRERV